MIVPYPRASRPVTGSTKEPSARWRGAHAAAMRSASAAGSGRPLPGDWPLAGACAAPSPSPLAGGASGSAAMRAAAAAARMAAGLTPLVAREVALPRGWERDRYVRRVVLLVG